MTSAEPATRPPHDLGGDARVIRLDYVALKGCFESNEAAPKRSREWPQTARLAHSRLSWRRAPYPIDSGPSAGEAGTSARAPKLPLTVAEANRQVGWRAAVPERSGCRGACADSGRSHL